MNDLQLARSHTRQGEPVQFGNDPQIMPGEENTYQSYGQAWANLSNTPFRLYKHWVHEGGIATPFIVHWPEGTRDKGAIRHNPQQLPDVMATIVELTGASYPSEYKGHAILPFEGESFAAALKGDEAVKRSKPLFFEHEGNAAVRDGKWKLVKKYPDDWELFDMEQDRTEMNDLASKHPELVEKLSKQYEQFAERCGVIPREQILELMSQQDSAAFWEESEEKSY